MALMSSREPLLVKKPGAGARRDENYLAYSYAQADDSAAPVRTQSAGRQPRHFAFERHAHDGWLRVNLHLALGAPLRIARKCNMDLGWGGILHPLYLTTIVS